MKEDFASAAGRHLEDARILHTQSRHDNAAYLLGYVVECSLKYIVQKSGLSPQVYGHRLDLLSEQVMTLAFLLSPVARRYHVVESPALRDILCHWKSQLRYCETGSVDGKSVDRWLGAASDIYSGTVVQAILDGMEVRR